MTWVYEGAVETGTEPFEAFFERERDGLFGALVLMTGDRSEAEEIAQDAFLAVWERWDRVHLIDDPAAYLHRTAVNAFRKRNRRAATFRRVIALIPSRAPETSSEGGLMLSEALAALTPRQRAALVLTEMLGYSGEETAEMLGIKASTVAALKYQGRAALKESEAADE